MNEMVNGSRRTGKSKQVAELEAQVKQLQAELDKKNKQNNRRLLNFFRRLAIILLVILTALFINLSIVALYVRRNIVNTDVWVSKTTQIIQTPSVRTDISNALAKNIFEKTDAKQNIEQILPERVSILAVPLTNTLQNFTAGEINKVMQSDQFIQFWQNTTKSAHTGIVQSLEAASSSDKQVPTDTLLYIKDENMYLNLQPVFDNIKARLSAKGLSFVNNINRQDINKSVPIAHINNFQAILAAFNTMNKAAIVLPILSLVFLIGAIALSVSKRLTIMVIAGLTIMLMVLNVQGIFLAKYPFISFVSNSLKNSSNDSAQAIFNIFTSNLILFDRLVMLVALLVILIAYLTGPFKFAVWLRKSVIKLFKGTMSDKNAAWISKNTPALLVVGGVVAGLFLVFQPVGGLAFSIVVIIVYLIFSLIVLSYRSKKNVKSSKSK